MSAALPAVPICREGDPPKTTSDDNKNKTNNDEPTEHGETTMQALRCSDPDLTIVLKWKDDKTKENDVETQENDDNEEDEEEGVLETKEYKFYSHSLALLSKFIDTALSVNMKEKQDKVIVLHDVEPCLFEMALNFVQDPCAIRAMTAEDVLVVAEFYNAFEFSSGLSLCDDLLAEHFEKNKAFDLLSLPGEIDLLVDSAALAYTVDLPKTKKRAIPFWISRLDRQYASAFTTGRIQKLRPMLREAIKKKSHLGHDFQGGMCFTTLSKILHGDESEATTLTLTVTDKTDYSHTVYYAVPDIWWQEKNGRKMFAIRKIRGTWTIVCTHSGNYFLSGQTYWKCPESTHMHYPPHGPWVPVCPHAQGYTPKIV